jgi:hypothetical protein
MFLPGSINISCLYALYHTNNNLGLIEIPNKIEVLDNKLLIDVTDPDKENPTIIAAITSTGGQVREVTQLVPTLEDVYLQIVKETK